MVYSTRQMYRIALDLAIKNGPRVVGKDGKSTAMYMLTKRELKILFVENGYSPRRRAWINNILDWTLWEVYISPEFAEDRTENGFVAFKLVGNKNISALHFIAENNDVDYYPHLDSGSVTA